MHNFQVNDYVKWEQDGSIQVGKIISVNKTSANIFMDYDWVERVPFSKLTYLPPIHLEKDEYLSIIRLDSDILKVLGDNVIENIINVDGYEITVEDFLVALQKILADDFDEDMFYAWSEFIGHALASKGTDANTDIYTEKDVLRSMHTYIYHPWSGFNAEQIPAAIEEGTIFLEDKNKPFLERRYPLYIKERLIEALENDAVMNEATDEHIELYRLFAEELAEANNIYGLNAVGYGCYGGNRAFDCDWIRSRDCISRLFEIEDEMPKKAFLANTLGYIYYYGRCNDGKPEYGLAYKYFSFAAFNGVYEAQYKIADMFKNGYGVAKSPETAKNIIGRLYNENIKYIRDGEFNCKFADVALRMGGIYAANEDDESNDYEESLYYYTQAEFAIRMRMLEANYYGDSKVCDAISTALATVKEKLEFKPKRRAQFYSLVGLLGAETSDGRKLDLVIKKQGELTYKMTFTAHKKLGEKRGRKLFITVPGVEMCGLFPKLTLTYKANEVLPDDILDRVLVVDEITYHEFYCDGARLLLTNGYYILKSNKKATETSYRFVSVSFGGSKLYDYLCDDVSVQVGDHVMVDATGEEKEVVVCRIFEKNETEMSLPLKAYKTILRKA
ncbi:MAG: sel1 repeat family protein [Clostridia bacterium]|nr:sel1 repeat family protein [Clostridia bacterium]